MYRYLGYALTLGMCVLNLGQATWAQITFNPQYSNERFPPRDSFHSSCKNEIHIGIDTKISSAHIEIDYNPNDIQITEFKWLHDGSFHVAYDQLIIDITTGNIQNNLAQLGFKNKENIEKSSLKILPSSYIQSNDRQKKYLSWQEFSFTFTEVPECEPDVVAPQITLISPQEGSSGIALDSYFIFDIKDQGKGIDQASLQLNLNDETITAKNTIKRSGSYLIFFPNQRLPVNQNINLSVNISDAQEYGWPNKNQKTFQRKTATGVLLSTDINPNMIRIFKQQSTQTTASQAECALLNKLYQTTDTYTKYQLKHLMQKVSCKIDIFWTTKTSYTAEPNINTWETITTNITSKKWFSVFALTWWIFFIITLLLKLHYIHGYHQYKKTHSNTSKTKPHNPLQ